MANPVEVAKSLNWQDPSKFRVQITGPGSEYGGLNFIEPEVLTSAIKSIELASITSTPIEEYIAEEWAFTTGRLENYQIAIGLQDYDNFMLYRVWSGAIQKFQREYPDTQKFDITIYTSDDFDPNNYQEVVTFKNCILTAVSGPTLDNSAIGSIAEFTLTMKCSYVTTY